jgi:hydrogenase-4 membrane subunit HyfE
MEALCSVLKFFSLGLILAYGGTSRKLAVASRLFIPTLVLLLSVRQIEARLLGGILVERARTLFEPLLNLRKGIPFGGK